VFSVNSYYQYYLESVVINDVDVQFFYLGRITDLLLNFDLVVFDDLEADDVDDWEYYEPYHPDMKYDEDRYKRGGRRLLVATERTEQFEGHVLAMEKYDTFKLLR
jgi:hypothetical protein